MDDKDRMRSLVALVPMRHHSQRVAGKNYREVAGQPLYAYILEVLLRCPEVEQIVVDTDSPTIWEGVAERFPTVRILSRPEGLRGDAVSMNEILVHDAREVPAELYLQTHATNPLLRAETLSRAVHTFRADPDHDSLLSVTRLQARLWSAEGRPINHDPAHLLQTQDLPPTFLENSCLYLVGREVLLTRHNRLGSNPMMFPVDAAEAWDIDEEFDLKVVECLLRERDRRTLRTGKA